MTNRTSAIRRSQPFSMIEARQAREGRLLSAARKSERLSGAALHGMRGAVHFRGLRIAKTGTAAIITMDTLSDVMGGHEGDLDAERACALWHWRAWDRAATGPGDATTAIESQDAEKHLSCAQSGIGQPKAVEIETDGLPIAFLRHHRDIAVRSRQDPER